MPNIDLMIKILNAIKPIMISLANKCSFVSSIPGIKQNVRKPTVLKNI